MKRTWLFFLLIFSLLPISLQAEDVEFLQPTITNIQRSLLCNHTKDDTCQTLFLIAGKRFVNSNGSPGVRVGNEWAEVIRASGTSIVAIASESAYSKTPVVTVDTNLVRPTFTSDDPILNQLFEESVDVAIASIHINDQGTRYVSAGPKYGSPDRVYYRDTYWTSGMILMLEPAVIRDQILLLSSGVERTGSTPSAIPVNPEDVKIPLWVDHVDAGPYFIMLVYDYISWTGDTSILSEQINGRSVFVIMEDIISWLSLKDSNGNFLPEKPANSLQDWLDSIPREGEVFSNQVLYYRSLRNLAELAELVDEPEHAQSFHRQSLLVRYMINAQFWNDEDGYYMERCVDGRCVEKITNESSLGILFDVANDSQRERMFDRLKLLETRHNPSIPFGDWGVVNVWPLHEGYTAYDYHNGTDWPFLDGMNAGARMKYQNPDWYYPLTRWWTYNQEQDSGRVLPENISPIDLDGGDQQAWSVFPIVSFIKYGLGLDPNLSGEYQPRGDKYGKTIVENILFRNDRISI